jgi:hypothetical protein
LVWLCGSLSWSNFTSLCDIIRRFLVSFPLLSRTALLPSRWHIFLIIFRLPLVCQLHCNFCLSNFFGHYFTNVVKRNLGTTVVILRLALNLINRHLTLQFKPFQNVCNILVVNILIYFLFKFPKLIKSF